MKLLIASILVFTLTIQSALANQSVELDKGQPAPYPGVLLDKEKSKEIRDELIEKDGLVKTNESLNKSIQLYRSNEDLQNQKSDILLKQNIELTKTLNDTRSVSGWEKVGFFILGVAITSAAVYGASKLAR